MITPYTYSISDNKYNTFCRWKFLILFTTLFPLFLPLSLSSQDTINATGVVINEIYYYQDITSVDENLDHEWIEIYNSGDVAVDIENWTVSNRDGAALITLPKIVFPAKAYLVIHFRQGVDDLDFSDTAGDYYSQDNHFMVDRFSFELDEAAIFTGAPGPDSIIDFVAWKSINEDFQGGTAHDYATGRGIWNEEDFFNADNASGLPGQKVSRVYIGTSIGRDEDSTDDNTPQDWDVDGGANAIGITNGKQNTSDLQLFISSPTPSPSQKEWTFMVYLDADNDLEKHAWVDINEMEVVSADDNVNVVVMVDWVPKHANIKVSLDNGMTFNPTTKAYRGYLLKDNNKKRATLYPVVGDNFSLGEINMGSPTVLTEFIQWGITNFPANKYAVVIWDHGLGWKATTYDDTNNDEIHMGELRDALSPISQLIDLIGFDQCLMAMVEVATQVYEGADVMVASEDVISTRGWPYDRILANLKDTSHWNAEELGKNIVNNFHSYYEKTFKDSDHTISAVALNNKFLELVDHISDFGDQLNEGVDDYKKHFQMKDNVQLKIKEDLLKVKKFDDENYIDLTHFAKLIKNNGGIPNQYKNDARPIIRKMEPGAGVIIAEKHNKVNESKVHGLSIYFPEYQTKKVKFEIVKKDTFWVDPYDDPTDSWKTGVINDVKVKYAADPDDCIPDPPDDHPLEPAPNFLFPQDTKWDEFLHRYYEPVADAGKDQVVFVGEKFTLDGSGSSDADGRVTRFLWDIDDFVNSDADDADNDCVDETNDDIDYDGKIVRHSYGTPGVYCVTLNVWDDHHTQKNHTLHQESDDDSVKITVLPLFHDPNNFMQDVIGSGAAQQFDDENEMCFDWTMGEWVIESFKTSEDLALCQGFHQGYSRIVDVVEFTKEIDIQVFPNPATSFVTISLSSIDPIRLEIFDTKGQMFYQKLIGPYATNVQVDVSRFPAGLYVFNFKEAKGAPLATYKILKTQ